MFHKNLKNALSQPLYPLSYTENTAEMRWVNKTDAKVLFSVPRKSRFYSPQRTIYFSEHLSDTILIALQGLLQTMTNNL